jgi:hypothetical protein
MAKPGSIPMAFTVRVSPDVKKATAFSFSAKGGFELNRNTMD